MRSLRPIPSGASVHAMPGEDVATASRLEGRVSWRDSRGRFLPGNNVLQIYTLKWLREESRLDDL